jgi:putative Holliday junction resolvase
MILSDISQLKQFLNKTQPILALDLGSKKIGFAVSDSNYTIAMPLMMKKCDGFKDKIGNINDLIDKHKPCILVVGLPFNMDGSDSLHTKSVRIEIAKISELCNVPIYLQDERMTTKAADNLLKASTSFSRKDRNMIDDSVSAALILESVLLSIRFIS